HLARPGRATVGGLGHVNPVACAVVVRLDVAGAVVRAARGVVADDPLLVPVAAVESERLHRVGPADAVAGAVHRDARAVDAAVDGQAGDQPLAVPGVVGDRRVTDPRIRAALVHGDPGKEPVLPGRATVGG